MSKIKISIFEDDIQEYMIKKIEMAVHYMIPCLICGLFTYGLVHPPHVLYVVSSSCDQSRLWFFKEFSFHWFVHETYLSEMW